MTQKRNEIEEQKKYLEKLILDRSFEDLELQSNEFNIFTALNIKKMEIRHSSFLAWLLNPNESHGLKDYFLISFLKKVSTLPSNAGDEPFIFDLDNGIFDDSEIMTEWKNIDILIVSEKNELVCIIENKIGSSEQNNQLERYKKIINDKYTGYKKLFVYLTVDGEDPSVEEYRSLRHKDISELIENLIRTHKDKASSEIITFIQHYLDLLRRYVMEDSKLQEHCRDIYKNHKKAIDLINEYKVDEIRNRFNFLIELLKNKKTLIIKNSNRTYVHFIPTEIEKIIPCNKSDKKWNSNINDILLFEFENRQDRLQLCLVIGPGEQEIRKKIHSLCDPDKQSFFKKSRKKLSPAWHTVYSKKILDKEIIDNKTDAEIKKKIEEKFADFMETDLPKIIEVIKKYNDVV